MTSIELRVEAERRYPLGDEDPVFTFAKREAYIDGRNQYSERLMNLELMIEDVANTFESIETYTSFTIDDIYRDESTNKIVAIYGTKDTWKKLDPNAGSTVHFTRVKNEPHIIGAVLS